MLVTTRGLPPAQWFTMSKSAGAMRRRVARLLWGPLASTRAGQSTPQVWHAPRGAWIRSEGAWSEWAAASVLAPGAGPGGSRGSPGGFYRGEPDAGTTAPFPRSDAGTRRSRRPRGQGRLPPPRFLWIIATRMSAKVTRRAK